MSEINKNTNSLEQIVQDTNVNICINDFYSQTGEYCGEWVGATLKKLPLWGESALDDDEINYEWPTHDQFA